MCFRPDESVLKIDRKFSGSERALVHQRSCLVNGDANELKLRVILDRFSAEVFINDGEQVMSAVIFTEQEAKGISFFAEGAAKTHVFDGVVRNHIYDLSLNDITGIGTPVFDPDDVIVPTKPEDEQLWYLAARIKVLKWRLVKQDVSFEGQ